ncbi:MULTISPECIES: stage VI sporulation protein D [unclassified Virgibacillus]|uniref:stage VI sporulation protein D n=1 Tax=unclassified Virgibacillus TaxID=2620237 RepID=UPI0024DEF326|nr:stage VI sporulation protein D [Virgibacillus sp. LDC-1]
MSNDQAIFSFELNETLYFQRGQEVAEIVGISLDPEILIQTFNEYISIRGVVELQGEYRMEPMFQEADEYDEVDDYAVKRYVERVEEQANDLAVFAHRFPVEISVPTYRVEDIENVTVNIASFDYEMPDYTQLRLQATIDIHGISDRADLNTTDTAKQQEADRFSKEENEEAFYIDIKKSEESASSSYESESSTKHDESSESSSSSSNAVESTSEEESGRWKKKKTQTLAEFFGKTEEVESSSSESSGQMSSEESSMESSSSWYESSREAHKHSEKGKGRNKSSVPDESIESSSASRFADLSYLSDMIRNDEERYAKMRLCIVQENDTLESIAERYQTTSMHIAKKNSLEADSVQAGQLLYIPIRKRER